MVHVTKIVDQRMAPLLSRAAREQLRGGRYPTFWRIRKGRFLGYLCSEIAQDGTWYAAVTLKGGTRRSKAVGHADDTQSPDGIDFLDFHHALQRAEIWFSFQDDAIRDELRINLENPFPEVPPAPPYTVANALSDYLRWYREHRKAYDRYFQDFRNHVLNQLGSIPLAELTASHIETWRTEFIYSAPIIATGRGGQRKYGPKSDDPEWLRKRRVTANGLLGKLKSALNHAFERGYVESDRAWAPVKMYRRVNQEYHAKHLTLEQARCLIDVCPDFVARVIKGGLVTGCRIGDLLKMHVGDYLEDLGRIKVVAQKNSRHYHIALSEEGMELFNALTANRLSNQNVFLNKDGRPWNYHAFRHYFTTAQFDAGFAPFLNFHRIRHTYAAHAVMAGLPTKVVASQLGHSTTIMIETRYGHLRDDFVSEKVRELMPRLFS